MSAEHKAEHVTFYAYTNGTNGPMPLKSTRRCFLECLHHTCWLIVSLVKLSGFLEDMLGTPVRRGLHPNPCHTGTDSELLKGCTLQSISSGHAMLRSWGCTSAPPNLRTTKLSDSPFFFFCFLSLSLCIHLYVSMYIYIYTCRWKCVHIQMQTDIILIQHIDLNTYI